MSSRASSPMRAQVQSGANVSNINLDESFSPVKLPVKTPIKDSNLGPDISHHKTPEVIVKHPHGLTAKYEARGSGSGSGSGTERKSLVQTPLIPQPQFQYQNQIQIQKLTNSAKQLSRESTKLSPMLPPSLPFTSPRHSSQKYIDIESIKKSKTRLDSKLNNILLKKNQKQSSPHDDTDDSGKENRNPLDSSPVPKVVSTSIIEDSVSSPLKRTISDTNQEDQGSARKLVKVNENEQAPEEDDHSIQIDEVFYKEDLVGKLSKSSPTINNHNHNKSLNPVIIDNDSDSDPDDFGRIENTISQTIIPNTIGLNHNNITQTQLGKIIRSEDMAMAKDYITPQRYTEPIAKSPTTNLHVRVNELENVSEKDDEDDTSSKSELRDRDRDVDITSPLKYHTAKTNVEKYLDNEDEIFENKLENEPTINFLMSPSSKPVFSLDHISKIQKDHEKRCNEFISQLCNKDERILTITKELNELQDCLIKYEKEIRDLKESKIKLRSNEEILSIQLKHNERELASLTKSFKIKENTVNGFKSKLNNIKSKKDQLNEKNNQQLIEINNLNHQISEATNLNIDNTIKIETLLKEKEDLLNEVETYKTQNIQLSSELEKLQSQQKDLYNKLEELKTSNTELANANSENESLIKEFESVANSKITELETTIANINKEKEEIYKTLEKAEEYEIEIKDLKTEINEVNETNHNITNKLDDLINSNDKLQEEINESNKIIKEKEEIINEDISKMTELVEAVQKKEEEYNERVKELQDQINQLSSEKQQALEQVENTKIEADNEVKRLAQYLHHEYAEKHAKKLGDVKLHYEKEKDSLTRDKRYAEREVELLKRKLNNSLQEIRQLTDFIDVNKLQYHGRVSPKKSSRSRHQ
ncbi:uncharacterized protein RJT21DRAFT_121016 [Scheffersomyces amazonensis]|uniref:uncharacterized protein n=1 Tax=Scheffersomyces amazonensis TaxID=1078765 RepID=UPI00315C80F2